MIKKSSSVLSLEESFSFDKQCFTSSLSDYEIMHSIGIVEDVSHGFVAKHIPSDRLVVLKQSQFELSSDFEFLIELVAMIKNNRLCRHENILKYYNCFAQDEDLWIVTEPIRAGSARHILNNFFPDGLVSESIIATILREVLKAITYMHSNHFIHNNIRADNIFLDSGGEVRLGGLYQMIPMMQRGMWKKSVFEFVGDPEWMAPEVLSQATTFDEKVDIYGIGITAMELTYGKTPFNGWPSLKILLAKLHYEVPDSPSDTTKTGSKHFTAFLDACLSKDPELRPTASQLLDHPFIKLAKNPLYLQRNLLATITNTQSTPGSGSIDQSLSRPSSSYDASGSLGEGRSAMSPLATSENLL